MILRAVSSSWPGVRARLTALPFTTHGDDLLRARHAAEVTDPAEPAVHLRRQLAASIISGRGQILNEARDKGEPVM